ncbi:restriction endonuclease subunit S [Novipirellula caenicola]|uniref:Type I restriction modification DNA specificity domain-containing protein n=1 Tax=Novipirellula caenicola TaxID=1536901 RepID=A0ABP9VWI8_9BACT
MATGQEFIDSCHELRQGITGRKVQKPVPMMPLDLPDLPESWTWTSLSSLCERVSVGHVGPTSEFFCEPPDGIPFIRSQDVRPGKLTLANVAHVVEPFHDKLKKSQLKSGDILIVRVGANRGDCCVVPDGVGSLNCANIVFARPLIPNPFLGFYFNSGFGQSLLSSLTTGSAQGVLNTQSIATIPVPVPPIRIQRKIASILSAYDDLIENNTRRIAILEEMAQAIYREWFVNFRFPGHENVKLVDSPLGQIPEGWEPTKLKDITTKIGSGATPRGGKNAYKDSGMTLIRSLNVYDYNFQENGLAFIDDDQAAQLDNVAVEKHDILLNITGASVARCCMVPFHLLPARVNQHVAIIRTDKEIADPFYVLTAINSDRHKKQLLSVAQGGATREALTKSTIQNFELVLPTAKIVAAFGKIVGEMFDEREILHRKNENLRTTRDLLLPKLISGKLDVEDLDIDVGVDSTPD